MKSMAACGMLMVVLACSGCIMTVRLDRSAPDAGSETIVVLQERLQKIDVSIQQMSQELREAPDDVAAIRSVLKKYGLVP